MELALWAADVSTRDRIEIDQILGSRPANFNQANNNSNFMIALTLTILKTNYTWKCISPAKAPNESALCTNFELLLA